MNIDHLVTMANQIGSFFSAYPDAEQAKKDIASHLKRFWEQRMRKQIVQHVLENQGIGLEPIVQSAIKEHLAHLN
jgi:formate dehydrogenase subunit delta